MNLVKQMVDDLHNQLVLAAEAAKMKGKINFENLSFIVEVPNDKNHGDFASNIAMTLAKQARMKPRDIAQSIVDEFNTADNHIEKVEIAGAGFINFYLNSF